jgi:protein-disulfide isomerase
MTKKRKVEVFTAGCPLCDETVQLVKKLTCPSCDVTVYDLKKEGMDKAKEYGVSSVPTVVVDGKIAECCSRRKPNEADLKATGIGTPL